MVGAMTQATFELVDIRSSQIVSGPITNERISPKTGLVVSVTVDLTALGYGRVCVPVTKLLPNTTQEGK